LAFFRSAQRFFIIRDKRLRPAALIPPFLLALFAALGFGAAFLAFGCAFVRPLIFPLAQRFFISSDNRLRVVAFTRRFLGVEVVERLAPSLPIPRMAVIARSIRSLSARSSCRMLAMFMYVGPRFAMLTVMVGIGNE
jgi:hypothetical protein